MKKHRKARLFLEELRKLPIISIVCDRVGLSRNTIYRWREEDSVFEKEMNAILKIGVSSINDLAESKLIAAMNRGEKWAIKYWLDNHHPNYIRPRTKDLLSAIIGEKKTEGFEVIIRHGKTSPTTNRPRPKEDLDWIDDPKTTDTEDS